MIDTSQTLQRSESNKLGCRRENSCCRPSLKIFFSFLKKLFSMMHILPCSATVETLRTFSFISDALCRTQNWPLYFFSFYSFQSDISHGLNLFRILYHLGALREIFFLFPFCIFLDSLHDIYWDRRMSFINWFSAGASNVEDFPLFCSFGNKKGKPSGG